MSLYTTMMMSSGGPALWWTVAVQESKCHFRQTATKFFRTGNRLAGQCDEDAGLRRPGVGKEDGLDSREEMNRLVTEKVIGGSAVSPMGYNHSVGGLTCGARGTSSQVVLRDAPPRIHAGTRTHHTEHKRRHQSPMRSEPPPYPATQYGSDDGKKFLHGVSPFTYQG